MGAGGERLLVLCLIVSGLRLFMGGRWGGENNGGCGWKRGRFATSSRATCALASASGPS